MESVVPAPTSTLPPPTVQIIKVEPTMTPSLQNEGQIGVSDLPVGEPGHYVNLTFGYRLRYPPSWYTGFGSRPILASFSNLDPGTHNRLGMRAEGCLIEVRASTNVYGLTLNDLRGQLPKTFRGAQEFSLGGESGVLVRRSSQENPFETEVVYVDHADRLFVLTFEYAKGQASFCQPVWEEMLRSWQWFEAEFVIYRNPTHGYALSHPRQWYRFHSREQGIWISSLDPTDMTDPVAFLTQGAMLVKTDLFDNPDSLALKAWVAAQDWKVDLSDDIPTDAGLIGLRVVREGPAPEIQEMSGYFQGPLGKIYEVTCLYPTDRGWEFRPIANAILYSFSF
jgi:hypothetical protein